MNLFAFFQEHKFEDLCDDEEECDNMCQSLIELTKLIAIIQDDDKPLYRSDKLRESLENLKANIETLTVIITNGFTLVALFDYEDIKFNGYRSIFKVIKKCIIHIAHSLKKIANGVAINRVKYEKQCKDYTKFLRQLTVIAKHLFQMLIVQKDSQNLFLQRHENEGVYETMMQSYDLLESEIFYGQCLGFYLCEPCQLVAKAFCSIQLGMGQAMSLPKSKLEVFVSTVVNSAQSWLMERKRGAQVADLFKQATIQFCKQFWNLVDHPAVISSSHLVLPYLPVMRDIVLEPIPLLLPLVNEGEHLDENISISPPIGPDGFASVKIRLLSRTRRQGMQWIFNNSNENDYAEASECLLIHCHGGGFVAQSSQSHDAYLRQWAIDLDYPIVSIDYSHAPEFPYPRAHEECLYAYCWVLKNLSQFGCSPDCRIVICGDSAGGNLALGCVLRVLQINIRAPIGIFLAYPATLVDFAPSPARMLGAFCPILPIGVLARCLLAYGGVDEECLVKEVSQICQSQSPDLTDSISDKSISKKNVNDSFLERDAYDSAGARIFYSKNDAVSPIVLLRKADLPSDPIMSPLLADDSLYKRLPPMSVFACEFDPLLDDSVELCKKAHGAGAADVRLEVMRDLPHGFLSMATPLTKDCMNATRMSIIEIKRLFDAT